MFDAVMSFFMLLVLFAIVGILLYKYRDGIGAWLKRRPVKDGLYRDLEVLSRYEVDDRLQRILGREEAWERDLQTLCHDMHEMKKKIAGEFKEKEE